MANFQPRKVPAKNLLSWITGAFELASRRPVTFISIWLVTTICVYLLPDLSLIHIPISVVALALSCIAAESADKSQSFFKLAVVRLCSCYKSLVVMTLGFTLLATFIGALVQLSIYGPEVAKSMFQLASSSETWHSLTFAKQFLYSFDWVVVDASGFVNVFFSIGWFTVVLVANACAPLQIALVQAVRGSLLNIYVVPFVIALQFVFDLLRVIPLAALPGLIIMSCMIYLSYKDIWIGTKTVDSKVRKHSLKLKLAVN